MTKSLMASYVAACKQKSGCASHEVQHDTVRRASCTAQHSTAQHSTAQHSTAQHSTAQHSTAQHSTAQHSTAAPASSFFLSSHSLAHWLTHSLTHSCVQPHMHLRSTCPPSGLGMYSPEQTFCRRPCCGRSCRT